ncbi:hypothetical protein CV_0838 [Chromobacterium violaceum ATCC 12472]|uniref:Uncharacterized protein n=1 Tax=Chromobacterium violaceum (strain ATCC 12472 / DSM 30191 / JCM 1249 / CCUG 213 / NBRC 12614 / NCIMB 9131 / NCTC 9757 / MK) TaxID=243365 RepID=Q7NZT3_CHRVO|nr:hypothetical protein CV_0838 [Chromobacterium violaceum ATCC 12472]
MQMKSGKKSGLGWQAFDKILPQQKYKKHIKPKIRKPCAQCRIRRAGACEYLSSVPWASASTA